MNWANFGMDFISYQENIYTTTPRGKQIFSILAALVQFESVLIGQQVGAGKARAKSL